MIILIPLLIIGILAVAIVIGSAIIDERDDY